MKRLFRPFLDACIIYLSVALMLWQMNTPVFETFAWLVAVVGAVAVAAPVAFAAHFRNVTVASKEPDQLSDQPSRYAAHDGLILPPHPGVMIPAMYFATLMCVVTLVVHHGRASTINGPSVLCLVLLGLILLRHGVTTVANLNTTAALHKARDEYERRLTHDPLTGLPTRSQLNDLIDELIERRHVEAGTGIVCFVDVDHLKTINDTLGHAAGDALIRHAADRLQEFGRALHLIRVGGDEFVVLAFLTPQESPTKFASDLLDHMLHTVELDNPTIQLSVSIGITTIGRSCTAESLLQQADSALYRAKQHGRRRCEFFDSLLDGAALQSASFEQQLRRSLARSDFLVHYLPIVDLRTGTMVGAEALLRWDRPGHGIMAPDRFLQQLQSLDLVGPVGRHIIEQACQDFVPLAHDFGLTLTLNLSLAQLRQPETSETILRSAHTNGLPTGQIVVELSEHSFSDDVALKSLDRLKSAGIKIAIDDFGSGATSLQQLVSLPADVLKFNRSYISGLSSSSESQAITKTLIQIADSCELRVIAEGIEESSQKNLLVGLGCRYGQGWLFSQAVPIHELKQSRLLADDGITGSTFEQWSTDDELDQQSLESIQPPLVANQ